MLALFLLLPVIISELSPGSDPEWVELYNQSETAVSLENWTLKDTSQKPKILSGEIAPHSYFIYEVNSGWLNNTGSECLSLFDNASPSAQIDTLTYGTSDLPTPKSALCLAKSSDQLWHTDIVCTKLAANLDWVSSTSVPPTPSHTPKPAKPSATPKPTSLPTNSPLPTPLPSPKYLSPLPTRSISPTIIQTSPISASPSSPAPTPAVLAATTEEVPSKKPIYQYILIGIGISLISFSLFRIFHNPKI